MCMCVHVRLYLHVYVTLQLLQLTNMVSSDLTKTPRRDAGWNKGERWSTTTSRMGLVTNELGDV